MKRPPIVTGTIEDVIDRDLGSARTALADPTPWRLWRLMHKSREILDEASVVRPESPLLEDAARWLCRSTTLLAGGKVGLAGELPLGDHDVPYAPPDNEVSAWHVADAILACLVARDAPSRKVLAGLELAAIEGGPLEADDLAGVWAAALQAFLNGKGSEAGAIEQAAASVDIAPAGLARLTVLDAVALAALARGDEDAFGKALVAAVRAHHAWYKDPPRIDEHRGWVALGPLALACAAHDRGWEVPVRSEYLPQALIERRYAD